MLNAIIASRRLNALEGTPTVVDALTASVAPNSALWDARPDPERFTLREVLAHLVDYDANWNAYLAQIVRETEPQLTGYSPDALAAANDYAHSDPAQSRARFRASRQNLIATLQELPEDDWERAGAHPRLGRLTVDLLAFLVLAHDGYHIRQIAEWVSARPA